MRKIILLIIITIFSWFDANCGYWKFNNEFVGWDYYNIAVKDTNSFYVIGKSQIRSRCEYTEDCGKTWVNILPDSVAFKNAVTKNGRFNVKSISYFKEKDYDVLLIGCSGDSILRTTDGGSTWQRINLKSKRVDVRAIKRINKELYYCNTDSSLHISEDLGLSWKNINLPIVTKNKESLISAYIIRDSLYLVTAKIKFQTSEGIWSSFHFTFKSTNKGATWEEYKIDKKSNLVNLTNKIYFDTNSKKLLSFITIQDTTLRKTYGSIYKSYDYGNNWEFIDTTLQLGLSSSINFRDSASGYIVADFTNILFTENGGLSWMKEEFEYSLDGVRDIAFLNEHKSLLLTPDKLFIKDDRITSAINITPDKLELFPNPAGDFITITLGVINPTLKRGDDEVFIYNTLGERVMSVETLHSTSLQINISDLPKGMYFVKVGGETAKFVKI